MGEHVGNGQDTVAQTTLTSSCGILEAGKGVFPLAVHRKILFQGANLCRRATEGHGVGCGLFALQVADGLIVQFTEGVVRLVATHIVRIQCAELVDVHDGATAWVALITILRTALLRVVNEDTSSGIPLRIRVRRGHQIEVFVELPRAQVFERST